MVTELTFDPWLLKPWVSGLHHFGAVSVWSWQRCDCGSGHCRQGPRAGLLHLQEHDF